MNPKSFGSTIRRLREGQQISLRKFADKVGISPTYLSKIERDEFPPPGEETVKKFAVALDQDPDELLALAGRVSSDLPAIIQQRPRELASFLRTAGALGPEDMAKLAKYVEKMKRSS
jgi:transcriptional regulator with XRE-family HTH domain